MIDFTMGACWSVVIMSAAILLVGDGHWHDSDLAKRILICVIGCLIVSFLLFMGVQIGGAR